MDGKMKYKYRSIYRPASVCNMPEGLVAVEGDGKFGIGV